MLRWSDQAKTDLFKKTTYTRNCAFPNDYIDTNKEYGEDVCTQ
jgi:hypothetical protein